MKQFEAMAKTVEEAIEQGLQELGVSIGDVDVMVVEEGSKGLFGLFGSRPAKVRLTVKASEEDPLGDLLEEKKPAKARRPRASPLPRRRRRKSRRRRSRRLRTKPSPRRKRRPPSQSRSRRSGRWRSRKSR